MALAKKNLDNLGFIGLQENFDESLLLLSYKMNWWPELQEERYMTSPKGEKKQEDIRTKELVKSVNEMDYEIYGYGKNIFVNEYQLMLDDLQKNYYKKSFNKLNELNQVLSMLKERYRQVNKK